MSTATASRPAVSVDELRRAYRAVQEGVYRRGQHKVHANRLGETERWSAPGEVLPVLGCAGGVGSTVTAVAIATAAGTARVVECCSATSSGLSAASTAELGRTLHEWSRGTRDGVVLDRATDVFTTPSAVPLPAPTQDEDLTVLDAGWEAGVLLASSSWLSDQVLAAPSVIAVTRATVPGLRRLEGVLALLEGTHVVAAVVGPGRKKWPREVRASMGTATRALAEQDLITELPLDGGLATHGLTGKAIPAPLQKAAAHTLRAARLGNTTTKG